MSTHGVLTESSRTYRVVTHDRKGREGKGRGREYRPKAASMTSGRGVAPVMDGRFAASDGGVR